MVFSVAHIFNSLIDMYDLLAFYCKHQNIPIVTRNAHADTYHYIFPEKTKRITKHDNISFAIVRSIYQPIKSIQKKTKFIVKRRALKLTNCTLTQTEDDFQNLVHTLN